MEGSGSLHFYSMLKDKGSVLTLLLIDIFSRNRKYLVRFLVKKVKQHGVSALKKVHTFGDETHDFTNVRGVRN